MTDPNVMRKFLEEYKSYMEEILKPTRKEIKTMFSKWKKPGYWQDYSEEKRPKPSPVQRVRTNIKRPESVVDKILRKPNSFPSGLDSESLRRMNDAVRARVVVYFLSNLPLIDRELRRLEQKGILEISQKDEDKPVAYMHENITEQFGLGHLKRVPKESGYVSIHYVLRLKRSVIPCPWFELQVRTLTEDAWGEIEHILGYKPGKTTSFAVRKQFQLISRQLAVIDEHFNFLYEELSRFQTETDIKSSHPLNPENLPRVIAQAGIGCAQSEISGLIKLLVSRGVKTVGELIDLATPRRLEIINRTYYSEKARPASNFEAIANLANLRGCVNENEEIERIKAQIAFLDVWEDFKNRERESDQDTNEAVSGGDD